VRAKTLNKSKRRFFDSIFEFSWLVKHTHACAYRELKRRKHTHTHTHTHTFAMVPGSPRGVDALGPRASVDDANDERNSRKRIDLVLSATTTTDPDDAASTRDNNSSAKRNNDSSSPATRKDSGSASSSGRGDGCDRRGGGGEDVEEEEGKQQQEFSPLEEESGRRSKRASIDVGDESTLERYRRIAMQHKQKQQEEEEEEKEEEEEDEEKQISSAKISERIKALLAQTRDEMNDKRDEDYDEAEDDMYNTCVYGEYERGGERDDEKEEENDAIYETLVEEEENLSELSSKYSEQMREVFINAKNAEAMEKKKGKAAFLSKKAAGEDDVKAFPASAEEGKKKMKMKKKGFLTGIFSSKSKKTLSSAAELGENDK